MATHEPGAYPAIPVQEYRDGPIEEMAVFYVRINRVVEEKAKRNKQQEDKVRSAELDFMQDLETLIKETAADPKLIELNCCLEDNSTNMIPNEYRTVAKMLTHRWGIIMVDGRIIVPKSLRYAALISDISALTTCAATRRYSGGRTCEKISTRNPKRARPA